MLAACSLSRLVCALILALALAGCSSARYMELRTEQVTRAVAVSTGKAWGMIHPPHVGQHARMLVRGCWREVVVTRVGPWGLVELQAPPGATPLDLEPGDSGSPAFLLVGRVKR